LAGVDVDSIGPLYGEQTPGAACSAASL
jgi:hypothetical protein